MVLRFTVALGKVRGCKLLETNCDSILSQIAYTLMQSFHAITIKTRSADEMPHNVRLLQK